MPLRVLQISLEHDDWSKLTSPYSKDQLNFRMVSYAISYRDSRIYEITRIWAKNRELLSKGVRTMKRHDRVLDVSLFNVHKSGKGVTALVSVTATSPGTVMEVLSNNSSFFFNESVWEGREHWLVVIDDLSLSRMLEELKGKGRVHDVREKRGMEILDCKGRLSEREREVLLTAYSNGFFDWPKKANAKEVAEILGITKVAFTQELRRALKKVVEEEVLCGSAD